MEKGYFGLGLVSVKVGDVVVILVGVEGFFILCYGYLGCDIGEEN